MEFTGINAYFWRLLALWLTNYFHCVKRALIPSMEIVLCHYTKPKSKTSFSPPYQWDNDNYWNDVTFKTWINMLMNEAQKLASVASWKYQMKKDVQLRKMIWHFEVKQCWLLPSQTAFKYTFHLWKSTTVIGNSTKSYIVLQTYSLCTFPNCCWCILVKYFLILPFLLDFLLNLSQKVQLCCSLPLLENNDEQDDSLFKRSQ